MRQHILGVVGNDVHCFVGNLTGFLTVNQSINHLFAWVKTKITQAGHKGCETTLISALKNVHAREPTFEQRNTVTVYNMGWQAIPKINTATDKRTQ